MNEAKEYPLVFVAGAYPRILKFLCRYPVVEDPPFSRNYIGLSTNRLDFSSESALSDSIVVPVYPGYADSDEAAFEDGPNIGLNVAVQLTSWLFRQDYSGDAVPTSIAGLWAWSPTLGILCGVNFHRPLSIALAGDGFSATVLIYLGPNAFGGKVIVIGAK